MWGIMSRLIDKTTADLIDVLGKEKDYIPVLEAAGIGRDVRTKCICCRNSLLQELRGGRRQEEGRGEGRAGEGEEGGGRSGSLMAALRCRCCRSTWVERCPWTRSEAPRCPATADLYPNMGPISRYPDIYGIYRYRYMGYIDIYGTTYIPSADTRCAESSLSSRGRGGLRCYLAPPNRCSHNLCGNRANSTSYGKSMRWSCQQVRAGHSLPRQSAANRYERCSCAAGAALGGNYMLASAAGGGGEPEAEGGQAAAQSESSESDEDGDNTGYKTAEDDDDTDDEEPATDPTPRLGPRKRSQPKARGSMCCSRPRDSD